MLAHLVQATLFEALNMCPKQVHQIKYHSLQRWWLTPFCSQVFMFACMHMTRACLCQQL